MQFNKNFIIYPFALSCLYWIYLFFNTNTVIIFDSLDYQALGKMIQIEGWIEYFKTGPNREPFYPFLISVSMSLSKLLSCSYLSILKLMQLLILLATQILSLKILKRLKINPLITAITIFYIGFSPALINTALSLYSEIATYPFILGTIILTTKIYDQISTKIKISQIIPTSIFLGISLLILTFTKGIFEIITPFYYALFIFLIIKTKKNPLMHTFVVISISFLFFYIPLSSYKLMNKKHNNQYVLTNRGAWALYGNTARRMEKLTFKKFLTALAYAPGEGVCLKLFNKNDCNFWSFWKSDKLGDEKVRELINQKVPNKKIDKILLTESKNLILKNPVQYILFYGIEGFKTVFWESTQIGFVEYPPWLTKLYIWPPIKDGLRLFISLLTLFALGYVMTFLWKNKTNINNSKLILFYISIIVFLQAGFYSFFYILTRYSLPVAPLYLILIAFTFNEIFNNKKKKNIRYEK